MPVPARDDPEYVNFLEAMISVLFVPIAALDMSSSSDSPEGCELARELARIAVDNHGEFVMQLMERWTGMERSPVMKAWLASRYHPERN
jgi:hypothetical protein